MGGSFYAPSRSPLPRSIGWGRLGVARRSRTARTARLSQAEGRHGAARLIRMCKACCRAELILESIRQSRGLKEEALQALTSRSTASRNRTTSRGFQKKQKEHEVGITTRPGTLFLEIDTSGKIARRCRCSCETVSCSDIPKPWSIIGPSDRARNAKPFCR